MEPGWDGAAEAWIAFAEGDANRVLLLDPVMLHEIGVVEGKEILDVGCGEGRFCRMLRERKGVLIGIDPTERLLAEARAKDPGGLYVAASAECLPFPDDSFDTVVSYLTLIDIPDFRAGIREMARVVRPGGSLLIANLNSFVTSQPWGWYKDASGQKIHYPVDRYNEEIGHPVSWQGISIINWHRPMSAYMQALLGTGLRLTKYLEPVPTPEAVAQSPGMWTEVRVPLFHVMEWLKT